MSHGNRGGCLGSLLYLLFIFFFVVISSGAVLAAGSWLALTTFKTEDPGGYREFARDVLGVSPSSIPAEYFLTEEGRRLAEEAGLDPERLARTLFVARWLDDLRGDENAGDWSILYQLTGGESGGCVNCGTADACSEYHKHTLLDGDSQCAALGELLEIWQRWDIRSTNPIAAEYVYKDYSGALGSVGGGALGCSQFLAGTAKPHLAEIGEPFDLWNPDTAMQVMALELYRLGWREDLSLLEKVSVLLGWNRNRSWVTSIAKSAEAVWATAGQFTGHLQIRKEYESSFSNPEDLKIGLLDFLGLMPETHAAAATAKIAVDVSAIADGEVISEHSFSISAQGDTNTDFNIRKIVGDQTGAVRLDPGPPYSMNALFGDYSFRRGFRVATEVIGGGACNFMSLLWYVAEEAGLECSVDAPGHAANIPEVPEEYWVTIWYGAKDLRLTNGYEFTVYIRWAVEDDILTLAIVKGTEERK